MLDISHETRQQQQGQFDLQASDRHSLHQEDGEPHGRRKRRMQIEK